MRQRNARIGMVLFCVYLLLYGGFVFLNAFAPETMEVLPFAGVNLAILYGFGLIIAAVLLALIYGWMCQPDDEDVAEKEVEK
ncbi:hypothetical protein Pan258_21490 [Symmachiella dynata]|uniref:DUF485 domain-containing protein n=1 Tax=Symmachiella dynata TaxID=2527995 RepID=UPI001188562A|nr:DUF485 domain-containing protein [Symmachiella dynata]QDT48109.1 hypothetical protein Pan258_21490 [Symmachiella dynata]